MWRAAFPPGRRGLLGVAAWGTVRGPGLRTLDLSLQKIFPISDKRRAEFRTEFINLTNTPIFNAPSKGLGPGLGKINSSQGARNIQFGLKIYY